jgi:hypothetical protein
MDQKVTGSEGSNPFPEWSRLAQEMEKAREPMRRFFADLEHSRQKIAATFRHIEHSHREISANFRKITEQLNPFFEELRKHGPAISRLISTRDLFEKIYDVQWLPHFTTPVGRVEEHRDDAHALDEAIASYYLENWGEVSAKLRDRQGSYEVNEESKAVFAEAMEIHERGNYRAVVRLLLPEVERLVCIETDAPLGARFAPRLEKFVRAAEILSIQRIDKTGLEGIHLWTTLAHHLFEHVRNAEELAPFVEHGIPNRHAAIHGVIMYTSHKHSVNTILMLDYVMFMLTLAKESQNAKAA